MKTITYAEVSIIDIINWFVKGYAEKPELSDYFIDLSKGKVILRLLVEEEGKEDCDVTDKRAD